MGAYYNEHDVKAAAWLRELIKQGHIAPGDVDERSIEDVGPDDLRGYTQCHFFAGIGVWSYALRQAGWPDDRPVWTGSCPCQPFSAAGKGAGFTDERHLWPAWFHLIEQCRPDVVFGEQVASKDGLAWVELVHADMEGAGYAVGALDLCAAGFGAPHIRQRLYFAGHLVDAERQRGCGRELGREDAANAGVAGETCELADADGGHASAERQQHGGQQRQQPQDGGAGFVDYAADARRQAAREYDGGSSLQPTRPEQSGAAGDRPGPTNGFWASADWLHCTDGKWRPVESGTFPLAHGAPARVGRLRGYGNAIVAPLAEAFVKAYLEC